MNWSSNNSTGGYRSTMEQQFMHNAPRDKRTVEDRLQTVEQNQGKILKAIEALDMRFSDLYILMEEVGVMPYPHNRNVQPKFTVTVKTELEQI